LSIGFLESEVKTQLAVIQSVNRFCGWKPSIFKEKDQIINYYTSKWWQKLIDKKKVDVLTPNRAKKLF
jgi:hypothetical protein